MPRTRTGHDERVNIQLIYAAAFLCHIGIFAAMIGRVSFITLPGSKLAQERLKKML